VTFKENTISNFLLYMYMYTHYIEIHTNKGANSYKLKIRKLEIVASEEHWELRFE